MTPTSRKTSWVDVEQKGKDLSDDVRQSVRTAAGNKVAQRRESLEARIRDPEALRHLAARLRQHVLDHLPYYLERAEQQLVEKGVQVHWARTGRDACEIISAICQRASAEKDDLALIVKSKSMVSEEIRLNDHLETDGFRPVETDLGEFVVQVDNDHPSHIVMPIIHKNRKDVARAFEREGLGDYTEDPEVLTRQARQHLREKFRTADVGITGGNFVIAETGHVVIVTNEGNGRMCSVAPKIHIALTGIEKVVAREADLAVLLKLLARSSTGQDLTIYTNFLAGPRRHGEPDGPEEMHVVFLDNGRSRILGSEYHEMLRCIRCGACLNVCPVYRQVSGHAYDAVYTGPMGAVLAPLLHRDKPGSPYVSLPKASSLCAACQEVCPVDIPIPEFLLALRSEFHEPLTAMGGSPPFSPWAVLASHPLFWRLALTMGKKAGTKRLNRIPLQSVRNWLECRTLPEWPEESFRTWWKKRRNKEDSTS